MQNTENIKELEIKRPKGLRDKIEQLNIKTKEIKENDLYEYIRIKDYIIDLEEDISKTNKIEEQQEMNSKLINIFGCIFPFSKPLERHKPINLYSILVNFK